MIGVYSYAGWCVVVVLVLVYFYAYYLIGGGNCTAPHYHYNV